MGAQRPLFLSTQSINTSMNFTTIYGPDDNPDDDRPVVPYGEH